MPSVNTQPTPAFLINATTRTVERITIESTFDIYKFIGNGCELFEHISLDRHGNGLWVDEEGRMKPNKYVTILTDFGPVEVAGNAVVLGSRSGAMKDPSISQAKLTTMVVR